MKNFFGIVAIIFSVLGFIPFVGMFFAWIALVLATVAALLGEKGLSTATSVICAINLLILTPAMWAGGPFTIIPSFILVLAPILVRPFKKGASS